MSLRCLIVDDSESFLQAAGTLLEREGVSVVGVASTGSDAIRRARQVHPDVVLVDIVLRGESGFDVARELERDERGRPSVILISTHSRADFAELIGEARCAGFVPKSELSGEAIRRLVG